MSTINQNGLVLEKIKSQAEVIEIDNLERLQLLTKFY